MLKLRSFYFAVILAAASITAVAQQSTPIAAVKSFYAFDAKHSQTFGLAEINARKKWFSAELYKFLLKEIEREKVYLKENPTDKPHFGDGLPFRPMDEPCEVGGKSYLRKISYGTVTIKGGAANVDVYFKYPKSCNIPDFLYAVNMEKYKDRWVVSDIRYFPGDTSLVEDLSRKEY